VLVLSLIRAIVNRRYLRAREMAWLEITPPSSIAKTPEATEQLFSVIHGTRAARPLKDKLIGRSPTYSFEIVSTRKEGIRYLLQLEKSKSKSIQKAITSYIPYSKGVRCTFPEFKCTKPCMWGAKNALDRIY
jgi:hypothetical protein